MKRFLLGFVVAALLTAPTCSFSVTSAILPKEADQIAGMRLAGLNKDGSQIPVLVATLEQSHDDAHVLTALHALAQMGAVEALPEIRTLENTKDPSIAAFAKVEEARLTAEHSAPMGTDGLTRADAIMSNFYQTLGVSTEAASSRVAQVYAGKTPLVRKGEAGYAIPSEVYVMRETADIVYRDFPHDATALADVPSLDFSLDYPSELKMRLAPLTAQQRIAVMVSDLAGKKKLKSSDDYEIQLLADEGIPAGDAIAVKLREMDADRQHYKGMGFAALFQALEAMGIPAQAATVDHFRDDKNGDVEYYANQTYYNIKLGLKQGRATAY